MKIGCILVVYNPNIELTKKAIDTILPQVDLVSIIDNSTQKICQKVFEDYNEKCHYISMNGNVGIAGAQNEGLRYLLSLKYDYILFMDQDSISPNDLVVTLLNNLLILQNGKYNVGGIGPRPINRQNNQDYKALIKKGTIITPEITEVSEIISSGSLIPLENFQKTGFMEDKLFIDGVDHEWCWRARSLHKMRFFISENSKLSHQLGEGDKFFVIRNVAISTPFRMYYQFRNYLLLIRRGYVPMYWKVINGIKYSIKMFYYPIFVPPRKAYFVQILRGIRDGILNR